MSLVTMKYEMARAEKGGYAVPAFNFFSFDNLVGIAKGAAEKKSPVIAMATMGGIKVMGEKAVVKMCEGVAADYGINMVLHLDHCTDIELLKRCVDNGFTSVMIDASKLALEENIKVTKEVVDNAHQYNVTVEAEIGHVGGIEDNVANEIQLADYNECLRFVKETGIDSLAPAIGTVHGIYKGELNIDYDLIMKLRESLEVPLVMHGGSGLEDDVLRKAIKCGITKINVNSDLQAVWHNEVVKFISEHHDIYDPRKVIMSGALVMKDFIEDKINLLK